MPTDSRDTSSAFNIWSLIELLLQRHRFSLLRLLVTQTVCRSALLTISVLALYQKPSHFGIAIALAVVCILICVTWVISDRVVSRDINRIELSIVESSPYAERELYIASGLNTRRLVQPAAAGYLRYEPVIWAVVSIGAILTSLLFR